MSDTLINVVSTIAIFQSLFMAVFFINQKKGRQPANRMLATILIAFSFLITSQLLLKDGSCQAHVYGHLTAQTAWLIGPLLYLYIKGICSQCFQVRNKDWLHFVPFGLAFLFIFLKYVLMRQPGQYIVEGSFLRFSILVQNFIYILASFRVLHINGLRLRSFFHLVDDLHMAWLRFFFLGCFIVWLIKSFIFITWDVTKQLQGCLRFMNLNIFVAFLFLNTIVYIALKRPDLFSKTKKYETSGIGEPEKNRFEEKLTRVMESEKRFLDPDLTLLALSEQLKIPMRYLSQVINERFHMHFCDYVNQYRIQESQQILKDPDHKKTVLEIAYDVGFNSKSTFNAAFKKYTGITPREFKKKISS